MASTSRSGREDQATDPFVVLEPPNKKMKSSVSVKHFDVFINHRGPDTKENLALQIYNSLRKSGVQAYLDCEETQLGDSISSAIKNAIFSATVHIAIFSPRYTESPWCLAELALMFQTKARIIPLFYHVDPLDFRYIKGRVADAFSKHEANGRYPSHDIQQWKDCLQNVSGIKGYEFNARNDDSSNLCNDIVSAVVNEKRKRKRPLHAAKCEVGFDDLMQDFHSYCQKEGEMRGKVIGIYGMGGSGKTTLAKYFFNRKHSEFSRSSFLLDVREMDVKDELTSVQSRLLNDLFPENQHPVSTIGGGASSITHYLRNNLKSSFLIVIDNVDDQNQLDALLPVGAVNPNSLVIVTTRDERLLKSTGGAVRYKMKAMNSEHGRELFCWHAFHRPSCKNGFADLVNSFVEACGRLPLALQVMGGHVFGRDKAYWKSQLDMLKTRLHKDIKDALRISFDALEEDEKQIFMDVACFFIGEDVRRAISIWKASGWRAEHALQTLKDKCLLEEQICFGPKYSDVLFEPTFILRMHDHLRDLGREMADNEARHLSHPRRLWRRQELSAISEIKDFQGMLTGSGRESLRCFRLVHNFISDFKITYFLESSKTSTDLQWLQLHSNFSPRYIPDWIPLQNLHALALEGVSPAFLWQRDGQVPLKLRDLFCSFCYRHYKGSTQDMCIKDLNKLVSSFGKMEYLERLQLNLGSEILAWNCFLKSIRELKRLQKLELKSFQLEGEFALSYRTDTIYDPLSTRSLEAITLCGAFKTRKVTISGGMCPNLKSLKLYSMEDLIEVDLTGVTTLECLVLLGCRKLRSVLGNDLQNLKICRIKLCRRMREMPIFGVVSCLKRIYISRCRKLQHISDIQRFQGLKRVWIAYCPKLKNIEAIKQLKGLKRIWIEKCTKLQGVICFKKLKELKRIFIGGCTRLQRIEGTGYLKCLESIIITGCPNLRNITGMEALKGLEEMIISDSPVISCVERLQRLPGDLTILVGRPCMAYFIAEEDGFKLSSFMADKIGDTLSMVDALCELGSEMSRKQVEEKIHLFHKTQKSLGIFIFCAVLHGAFYRGTDICNGTRIMLEKNRLVRPTSLSRVGGDWIYMCAVNEAMLSIYDSWMPSEDSCSIRKAYLMGMMTGEERKAISILQNLFAQLCTGDAKYGAFRPHSEWEDVDNADAVDEDADDMDYINHCIDYDDLADYAASEEDEEDGDDDDHVSSKLYRVSGEDEEDGDDDDDVSSVSEEDEERVDDDYSTIFQSAQSTSSFHGREHERDPIVPLEPPNKRLKSSLTAKQYDVFINYTGPDVKTRLAVQLYDSLEEVGIRAYLASEETEPVDPISSIRRNAIFSARVHIAIFSPRYAESPCCLAELALIFQTKARIIPIFYDVEPSDFRYIKGDIADAFSKHEEKGRYPNHDIQEWKERLQTVSGFKGYEFNGQIESILSDLKNEVEFTKVGLDELVEDFEWHYQQKRELKDNIIGIYGMGGSGKTTLACELFNRKRSKYSRLCALFGVREASRNGDLTSLQTKLLNNMFYQNLRKFSSTEEGIRSIKRCLGRRSSLRFLILIDDVDQKSQLDDLVPIDILNSSSLVIITTRDERVLIETGIRVRYRVKGMDQQNSRQLFCWHAFHKPDHEIEHENLVECFVNECGGLPLSLQVLGKHVSGRSKEDWNRELAEVRRRLPNEIKDVLKSSYDSLKEEEKQIFMDIGCFFVEKDQSIARRIWKASGWEVERILQMLRDKCLVEVINQDCWNEIIDEESPAFVFRMHNHLQYLAREMAGHGENLQTLTTFKAIFEKAQEQRRRCFDSIYDETISENSITYFIGNSGTSTTLQWLELNGSESIPSWLPLEKLEGLRIRRKLPRKLWEAPPSQLKELVCKFTNCGWMERAMLRRNWKEFTDSLGILRSLESLVIHLESQDKRKDIVIEWKSFVESVRKLNCLKTLGLSGLYINGEIAIGPSSEPTESKLCLEALTLSRIGHTSKVSISGPSLKSLKLKHMKDLAEVNLSGVETLGCLELFECGKLTKVLADALPKLEILSVERCWEIQELPNLCHSEWLEGIKLTSCEDLQNIIGMEKSLWVDRITITCCPKLQSIEGVKSMKGLNNLIVSDGAMLSCVSELQELPSEFTVVMGRAATSFPELDEIAGIAEASPSFQKSWLESKFLTSGAAQIAGRMTVVNEFHNEEAAYNILQLISQKRQPSPSAIILCAMIDGEDDGSKYMVEGRQSQTIDLSWAGGKWIYTILVNSRKQISSGKDFSWMPTSCRIENGYILSVKEGQEFETLSMLKRLTERLYRTDTSKSSGRG